MGAHENSKIKMPAKMFWVKVHSYQMQFAIYHEVST
jgi:hypothetical protein